jgi:LPXTG-motif cell wall-anchored protein
MLTRKAILSAGILAFVALLIPASAAPQELNTNQRTFFTFSAPVQLPGTTLPAGKYQFQLANSSTNRHIVQVYSADGAKMITTILAIPASRSDVPENAEIRFFETPANMPPAIQTWWFPGTRTGHEFIYPKSLATQLAKTNKGVLTTEGDEKTGALTRLSSSGETKVSDNEAPVAVTGKAQAGESAPTPPQPAGQIASAAPSPRTALPHTATDMTALVIIGCGALALGLGLFSHRQRRNA